MSNSTPTVKPKPESRTRVRISLRTRFNAVLALEGIGALALQMLAIRQAAPWTGQSIVVVSVMVSTFLGALAAGYALGGRYTGPNPRNQAGWMLIAAGAIAAILATHVGTGLIMNAAIAAGAGTVATAAAYAATMVAPCAACLGRAVVLIASCYPALGTGARTGKTLSWSTAGNVGGGLVVPLVVMQWFGTEIAVAVAATALTLAGILTLERITNSAQILAIVIVSTSWGMAINDRSDTHLSTAYGHYRVTDHSDGNGEYRILWASGTGLSRDNAQGRGFGYVERIEHHLWKGDDPLDENAQIVVLGAAGMSLGKGHPNAATITYVDIEPKTQTLANMLQGGKPHSERLTISDARTWTRLQDEQSWDALIVDVYSGRYIPVHMTTIEWMREARSRVRIGGYFIMNTLVEDPPGLFGRRIDTTVRTVFGDCEVERSRHRTQRVGNRFYVCRRNAHDADRTVYRDTLSSAAADATWTARHAPQR